MFKEFKKILDEFQEIISEAAHTKPTKIKIKKGSNVVINGAHCTLLDDVIVQTYKPKKLMKLDKET